MTRLETILGASLACYFLVGRWSPSRLLQGVDPSLVWQPRVWLVGVIAVLGAARFLQHFSTQTGQRPGSARSTDLLHVALLGLLLQAYMAASFLWTSWAAEASPKWMEIVLLIVVQLGMISLIIDGDLAGLRDTFWRALMWLVCPMAVLAVAAATGGERVAVLAGGPNAFGRNMGILMLGSLYFWQSSTHRRATFVSSNGGSPLRTASHALAIVVGGMLLVMSGSRGAMTSALAGFLLLYLLRPSLQLYALARWAVVPVLAWGLLLATDMGRHTVVMFQRRVVEQTFQQRYTADRSELFQRSLLAGLDNPLRGMGLDALRAEIGEYPHNLFLEAFAEGGAPGLLLALGMVLLAVQGIWRRRRSADVVTVAAFALVLTAAQFSGDLYDSRGVFLFSLLALIPHDAQGRLQQPDGEGMRSTDVTFRSTSGRAGRRDWHGPATRTTWEVRR